jgi:hypothetical protein
MNHTKQIAGWRDYQIKQPEEPKVAVKLFRIIFIGLVGMFLAYLCVGGI